MNNICGIYKITLGTAQNYIGQSVDILNRVTNHKSKLKHNRHYNYKMQETYNITQEFQYEVLEECTSQDLNSKEIFI